MALERQIHPAEAQKIDALPDKCGATFSMLPLDSGTSKLRPNGQRSRLPKAPAGARYC